MQLNLANGSLILFGLSVAFWVRLTLFEAALVGMSLTMKRVIVFLLLVLPAGIGATLGIVSLRRRHRSALQAIAGRLLNGLFALFHLMILAFAG